jgi:O-antigen/teichoic acid export membrane protein
LTHLQIFMSIIKIATSPKSLALLGQAVASGGNFVLGVLLARWLGMEAFGQYSLLWMGVLFLLSLHQAYISQPLMALLPGKREETQAAYLEALSALQVLLSVGIATLVLAAYFMLKLIGCTAYWLPWFPVMGFLLSFYFLQEYLKKLCFATKRTHVPLLMDGAVFGFLLPMLALLHFRGNLSLGNVLTALLFAYAASAGLGARLIGHSLIKHWKLPQLICIAKEHYHYSFWLLGTSLVQWFSGNYFLVAAAGTLGAVAVGALRMAQNMVGLCHVLFLAMENIVPAEAARQFFTAGDKAMFAYLRRVGLLGGIPVGLLLGGLTLTAPWLIDWLYGADYQEFAYLVGAYAVVYALAYIATLQRFALRSMQFTSPIFIAYTLSAVASVLVAHPIVKHWGIGGVVAGLIGAQVLMLLVYGFFIWKKHQRIGVARSQADTRANPSTLQSSNPSILSN